MDRDNGKGDIERALEVGKQAAGGEPKLLQQIVVALLETSPGVTVTHFSTTCNEEIACRGLFDKGRVVLDEYWRLQNAPKMVDPGKVGFAPGLLKRLRG